MADFTLSDVNVTAVSLCKRGANGKRFFLKKMELLAGTGQTGQAVVESTMLFKADDWRVVYSIVAEPGNEEKQGIGAGADPNKTDVWASEQEIFKAAHGFMRNGGLINFAHKDLNPVGRVVENFIAPADFEMVDPLGTAQPIKKGAWIIGIEPNDDLRTLIDSGDVDSVSYEGTGVRTAVAKGSDNDSSGTHRKCSSCGGKIALGRKSCQNCSHSVAKGGLPDADAIVGQKVDPEHRSLLQKIAVALGWATEDATETHEEDEVPLTDQEKAALAKVEGIETKLGEVDTKLAKVDELSTKLDGLLERLPEPEKDPEEEKAEIVSALEKATETIDGLQTRLDKLEQGRSTQSGTADDLKKTDPDAALAHALFG